MDPSKKGFKRPKMSQELSDAEHALQHGVVRGLPKEEIDALRVRRDALQTHK